MANKVLFFDNNGVISDSNLGSKLWKKGIAEFFAPRFGGEPEKWMEANVHAMKFIIAKVREDQEKSLERSRKEFDIFQNQMWIEKMFDYVGIAYPPKSNYMKIQQQADAAIIPHIDPSYRGIKETIKSLKKSFHLHTASSENSQTLGMKLKAMNIRTQFDLLFGSDLVNTMKTNSEYYERIFEYSKTNPQDAIVIDDNPVLLHYAESTGAEVIQSCLDGQKPEFEKYFTKPMELLDIV